jgi:hypothetical protein
MKPTRWQDWVNVVLGVWLVASPWMLGFSDHETAALVAWLGGAAVVVFAGVGAYMQEAWEEAITVVLGLLLMGAPWAFGFTDERTATTNVAASGVLVVVFAILAMLRDMDIRKLKEEGRQAPGTR